MANVAQVKEIHKATADLTAQFSQLTKHVTTEITNVKYLLEKERLELSTSMQYMSDSFEEMKTAFKSVQEETAALKMEVPQVTSKNCSLERELSVLRAEVVSLKQYSRRNNVEIRNFPLGPNENSTDLVCEIATKLGVDLSPDAIEVAHRVPTQDPSKLNIIARFFSREARDSLVSASRRRRLTTSDFGYEHNEPVYVNEHLCQELMLLLEKLSKKKGNKWRYAWVKDGKIFVRRTENSKAVQIQSEKNLRELQLSHCV
ncbi:uncharacterized protein LOC135395860 [Ornithodoros turicata]|uniref:uncharacterized protein LOC135395860 n=1 Tax=Ornithodoros turicata TaxID=34597 RepID=UPI0031386406